MFLPYAALLKTAVVDRISDRLAWNTLSFRHFRFALWQFSGTRLAMVNTLLLGLGAATGG